MFAKNSRIAPLALVALGVVYGDIGTSPLYTIKTIFSGAHHPVPITPANILGILSLIVWSLLLVISIKYIVFIMRADNKGEGGIIALMALVVRVTETKPLGRYLLLLGLFGAALFYGDSALTPAISVLSAIEGLEIAADSVKNYVVPISLLVLLVLFLVQKHGTARVGGWFGPIIVLWFLVLGVLGLLSIVQHPQVLLALNPHYALTFFSANPRLSFFSLSAVVLAITGGEALYADMGHLGRQPVQLAWFGLVLPGLVLNYFGQGALLLDVPQAIQNPFYLLAPRWALYPMVLLATAATVIASQAVITGAFSLTRQIIQLGYLPRMQILHTSEDTVGQIYLPAINWLLLFAVVVLVIGFRSSTDLAGAYGIAVTGTMMITTILAYVVVTRIWRWHGLISSGVIGVFLWVDGMFFSSNLTKIADGGWFPLVLALVIFSIMVTWKQGRLLLNRRLARDTVSVEVFLRGINTNTIATIPGTAVFLSPNPQTVPSALLHSLKHYKSLHQRVIFLTVETIDVPYAPVDQAVSVTRLTPPFFSVTARFGFMQEPNLPVALQACEQQGLAVNLADLSYFLGRETLIPKLGSELALWREKLFISMYRNASSAAAYFHLPPNRVIELGTQVVL
ncbi:MAG: potassium transporter Kup [Gammaproteobacteria bacterium]|nr:potassium transporter Kup [Gammaproteobacteria bacterium]